MSTLGFFEHILNNARSEFNKISSSTTPKYSALKKAITEALNLIDISINYEEITEKEGEQLKNELKQIFDNLCVLPEIRKKGLR